MKWRVFGFLLGFCLLLLIILWLFQTVFLNDFYRYIRVREIRNNADVIISHIQSDYIYNIVMRLSEDSDFSANIVDMDGVSLLSRALTRNQSEGMGHISDAIDNGGEFYVFSMVPPSPKIPETMHYTENLIYVRITDEWVVIISAVVSPVAATVTTLRYQLYMVSGIMLVLAIILAVIISKRISKPIEEISHSTLDLAKGNYDTRFSEKGFYEIAVLSKNLNVAATELGKTETLRRELLANVSHDLRTPLSLIYSHGEMMRDFPNDINQDQIDVILNEAKRLTTLVNDVLDISKLEAGMEQLNCTYFNLTENIKIAVEQMNELLKNQKYDISFSYDIDITIEADETKINSAFYNLLVNAVNYSGLERKLSITQTTTEAFVKISVADSGDGISETDLPFIWDRYYKSTTAHKRAVTGTGLGLSIVKKIIELHNGRYGVISEVGKGSTFWIELRLAP